MSGHPVADGLQGALLDAIQDVLAANGGGMVNGFLMVVDYIDGEGEPSFAITVAPDQRAAQSSGLVRLAAVSTDRDLWNVLGGDDD
jgi:hypothetical protein